MRGTDGANTVVPLAAATDQAEHDATQADIAALNDIAATDIVSAGAITTLAGAVVNVDLVDVTNTNNDMRGTDSANIVVPLAAAVDQAEHDATQATLAGLNDIAATDIVSAGAITTLAGAVVTVTNNTDMRGTDGANTVVPMSQATSQAEHDATQAAIIALNNIDGAEVLTQVNAALDTAISELGVGIPAVTPTLRTGLMLLYMALRNKVDVDTTAADELQVHNDAGVEIATKVLSDDGTVYSEAKMISG